MSDSQKPVRLLLIEDSEADAELVLRALTRAGFAPSAERVDTREAVASALRRGPWDLVLCDNSMPGFSGAEALRLVRSLSPGLPFAFLSGTRRDPGPAAEDGVRHLEKGQTDELVEVVSQVLSGASGTPPSGSRSGSHPTPGSPLPVRPRILIVDDQPENLLALETALEGVDAEIVRAGSGEEALARLLDGHYALILLDVRMPGMSGLETAVLFRKRERTRWVPVIFLTASMDSPAEAQRGYQTGCVDYLAKPFVTEVLRAKVGVFLELWKKTVLLERQAAELRAANEDLEGFAGSAAHDLRAPLRAIEGYSRILSEDYSGKVLDEAGQAYLKKIGQAAGRMDALIRDLLAYAHLSLRDLTVAPLDVSSLVDEILSSLAGEIRGSGAEVRVERPLGCVRAHALLLRQAVENLVTNALKFTPPGKAPHVRIRSELVAGQRRRLWVEDQGIGISKGEEAKLFHPFSRLRGASAFAGTGLGLATVKQAAAKMGGSVGLVSEPGRGSRFFIELPESPSSSSPGAATGEK